MAKPDIENQRGVNLYKQRDPGNHIEDGEPRALYWTSYRKRYLELGSQVIAGELVPPEERLCIIANNLLQPHDFDLKRKDRFPIGPIAQPGKSAHIFFSPNPHEVCGAIMDRDLKRQDAVYDAAVDEVQAAGWVPVFAPTPNQPLHVRLIPTELVGNDPVQPSMRIRRLAAELFSQSKVRRNFENT